MSNVINGYIRIGNNLVKITTSEIIQTDAAKAILELDNKISIMDEKIDAQNTLNAVEDLDNRVQILDEKIDTQNLEIKLYIDEQIASVQSQGAAIKLKDWSE